MFTAEQERSVRAAHRVWAGGEDLYAGWYAAPRAGVAVPRPASGAPPLVGQLRVAHSTRWTPGCRVVGTGLAGTVVVATPDGITRAVSLGDHWVPAHPGRPARAGDLVVAVERAGGYETEGWWRTWGGGWDVTTQQPDVTRFYLSIRPERVLDLVRVLPPELDAARLRWSLKVAARPELLTRPDAVVLYVDDADAGRVAAIVVGTVGDLVWPDGAPPLTASLAPGVAWSHDPGTEQSFGQTRCELLAEAFAGCAVGDDPVRAAAEAFTAAGLDPARPHLRSAT